MIEKQRVKHTRIDELRKIFQRTGTRESLVEKCNQWGVSAPTIRNYIQQVHDDLEKIDIKRRKLIIAQRTGKSFSTRYDSDITAS